MKTDGKGIVECIQKEFLLGLLSYYFQHNPLSLLKRPLAANFHNYCLCRLQVEGKLASSSETEREIPTFCRKPISRRYLRNCISSVAVISLQFLFPPGYLRHLIKFPQIIQPRYLCEINSFERYLFVSRFCLM